MGHTYALKKKKLLSEFLLWHKGNDSASAVPGHLFDPGLAQWVKGSAVAVGRNCISDLIRELLMPHGSQRKKEVAHCLSEIQFN